MFVDLKDIGLMFVDLKDVGLCRRYEKDREKDWNKDSLKGSGLG